MPKRSKTASVLTETVITAAAEQLATRALDRTMNVLQDALDDMGFDEATVAGIEGFQCWDAAQEELEALIRDVWIKRARDAEQAMRDAGENPEVVAGLKAPDGVLLS